MLRCGILLFELGSWCGSSVMWVGVGGGEGLIVTGGGYF